MTPERKDLLARFAAWEGTYNVDFEELLNALGDYFSEKARVVGDPNVAGCYEGVAQGLQQAALSFYASTK